MEKKRERGSREDATDRVEDSVYKRVEKGREEVGEEETAGAPVRNRGSPARKRKGG